jgi:hypothetical protein
MNKNFNYSGDIRMVLVEKGNQQITKYAYKSGEQVYLVNDELLSLRREITNALAYISLPSYSVFDELNLYIHKIVNEFIEWRTSAFLNGGQILNEVIFTHKVVILNGDYVFEGEVLWAITCP